MSAIMKTEFLDRPPAGDWFALDVMREAPRKRRWVVLMIDVHPDELKHCRRKTAFLYVHPKDYRPDPAAQRRRRGFASRASIATEIPPGKFWNIS